jgi:hypothetical protein
MLSPDRSVSWEWLPFVPPTYGSLGDSDSSKMRADQPDRTICLTFASGDWRLIDQAR